MARTKSARSMTVSEHIALTNFLGAYSSKGVAQASLKSLAGIYRSPSITRLGEVMPVISDRAKRARVPSKTVEQAIQVVFFKKLGQHTPSGITNSSLVDFVTRQFVFRTESVKADSNTAVVDDVYTKSNR